MFDKPPSRKKTKTVVKSKRLSRYHALRKGFLDRHPLCERCGEKACDIHHKKGRGAYLLEVDTWMSVCRGCHDYIGQHPFESYEMGWMLKRND